jgi:hypothetical protein
MKRIMAVLAIGLAALAAAPATGQTIYWDTTTSAGYQHGDGAWSDNLWSSNGTTLEAWANGGVARFSATTGGSSVVTLNGTGVTASGLTCEGNNYTLIVTNGGVLESAGNFIWGHSSAASTNNQLLVVGGPGVTSRVSNVGSFWVGYAGQSNVVIVDGADVPDSAVVSNAGGVNLGYTHASSRASRTVVRRGGRLVVTGGTLIVGRSGDEQELWVEAGGRLQAGTLYLGNSGGHSNRLVVTGSNTVVDQVTGLYVANDNNLMGNRLLIADGAVVTNVAFRIGNNGCMDNTLSVTHGGRLYTTSDPVNIGYLNATGNMALVSGADALWDLGGKTLEIGDVGQTASSNTLVITDGGRVSAGVVTVVSNNALQLLGGSLIAGRIVATGEMALAVGDGVQAAALILTNKALASIVVPGLIVQSNSTLTGSATLSPGTAGVVIAAGGRLAPGLDGLGVLTNIGAVTLEAGSESCFEIATNTVAGAGWDLLSVTNGTLLLGGTLKPVLRAGCIPAATDRFVIITNRGPALVTGAFDNVSIGHSVTAYKEDETTRAGSFKVDIGGQGVILRDFKLVQPNGMVLVIF